MLYQDLVNNFWEIAQAFIPLVLPLIGATFVLRWVGELLLGRRG